MLVLEPSGQVVWNQRDLYRLVPVRFAWVRFA